MNCFICDTNTAKIEKHHVNYKKNKTIFVCRSCHRKIHGNSYNELKPTDENTFTIITVSNKNREKLEKLKKIKREPINDVITKLLKV